MKKILFFCFVIIASQISKGQNASGIIYGTVVDAVTKQPIPGANIIIPGTDLGAASNEEGRYRIEKIPPNVYSLRASVIGYTSVTKTSIAVLSGKPVQVDFELSATALELGEVTVTSDYFNNDPLELTSTRSFNYEEIRRSPGGFEDVIRSLSLLPGVAQADAGRNDLIVRGGAPSENLYIIDGIEVPNINHFGTQGAAGGPLSYVNLDFVKETSFSTGGFPVIYGDRISSTLKINLRNGRNDRTGGKVTLSATQFGLNLEGPLPGESDFIFSVRRSYLDFIFKAADFSFVPEYYDLLTKFTFKINNRNTISFLTIGALDNVRYFNETEEQRYDNSTVLGSDQLQYFSGITWRNLFNNGFIDVTYSRNYSKYNTSQRDSLLNYIFKNDSKEIENKLKADLTYRLSDFIEINTGLGFNLIRAKADIVFPQFITTFGDTLPITRVNSDDNYTKFHSYLNLSLHPFSRLLLNTGVRIDYFNPLKAFETSPLSPRFSLSFKLTEVTNLIASAGLYHQAPSYIWLAADVNYRQLKYIKSHQYIAGIDHRINPDTQLKLELFYKEYSDYTASLAREYLVLANTGAGFAGSDDNFSYFGLEPLASSGRGTVRGAELSLQKKLSEFPLYGILSLTYSRAVFAAIDGIERTGSYDQTWIFNFSTGYKFNRFWEAALKFRYSTGKPYTPFNADGTQSVEEFNTLRLSANHSLDLRIDRHWFFDSWTLITYIDIQNIYNRKNQNAVRWDARTNSPEISESIGILPSVGISAEL
ncbi:MAG: TonB-dependent receptor [Ignavibacteriaceae bacterium]